MTIVEIQSEVGNAHKNLTSERSFSYIPEGWAVLPDGIKTPGFPFGRIETELIGNVLTVVNWTPVEIPKVPADRSVTMESRVSSLEDAMLELMGGLSNV